jgi:flagellar basal-body rod modification protein FlgD
MLTFPKSIADPSAAPVAGFVANKTTVPTNGATDGQRSFADTLKAASGATKTDATAEAGTSSSELTVDNENSEDKFLTLLVAQMRNQDPLNPLDNAQVTSQLAQINTVRGIEKLNTSMGSLIERIGAQGELSAADLIDRQVLVEGDELVVGDDETPSSLAAGFELPVDAEKVSLQIFDASGEPVADMDLGAMPAGVHPFVWDGKDADGNALDTGAYQFVVSAMNGNEQVSAVTLAPSRVVGVTRGTQGYDLELASGAIVARDSVRGVR